MNSTYVYDEIKKLLVSYISSVIIFKITFSNTELFKLIIGSAKFYLILILPAMLLTYLVMHNLDFIERLAISYFIGLTFLGIVTYYSGIFLNTGIMITIYSVSLIASASLSYLIYRAAIKSGEQN